MQTADTLDKAKKVNLNDSAPGKAGRNNPYFAHLAMCKNQLEEVLPIEPPLGWALSSTTKDAFNLLLLQCGNDAEWAQLEIALGKGVAQEPAASP